MAAVVVAQNGVAALKGGGYAVPHLQVASEGVTQNDYRPLALLDEMKCGHLDTLGLLV